MSILLGITIGIDTILYYKALSYSQMEKILSAMMRLSGFFTEEDDYEHESYSYRSEHFADKGIRIRVSKRGDSPWGLYVLIHPTLLLGNDDRSALYRPTKGNYQALLKHAKKPFSKFKIPFGLDQMKLCRADVTINLLFKRDKYVAAYLRIIKKSLLLAHYKLDWFREGEHRAKDVKEANKNSYTQRCKSASYFVYGKDAQLKMIGKFPETLKGKHVLRLEAQLRSKAMKKWGNRDAQGDQYKTLRQLVRNGVRIHRWYLKRMGLLAGEHLRFEDAVEIVSNVKGKKTRRRMLDIMDALSFNNVNLSNVIQKLDLKPNAVSKAFKKFSELGISPITVPNAEDDALPSLAKFIRDW